MRLGVCELNTGMMAGSERWKSFVSKVRRAEPEILLLNEMPFGPWIAGPDGELLAQTSEASPVACCEIDPDSAVRAQSEYPCYVPELG